MKRIQSMAAFVRKFLLGYRVFDEADYSQKRKLESADLNMVGARIDASIPDVDWRDHGYFSEARAADVLREVLGDVRVARRKCIERRYLMILAIGLSQVGFYYLGLNRG